MLISAIAFDAEKEVIFMQTNVPQAIIQGWYSMLNFINSLCKLRKEDSKFKLKNKWESLKYRNQLKKHQTRRNMGSIISAFLFNESTSDMKVFSAANPHMALLDIGSPVTALRRADLLSDLRILDNELLVFGNNEGSKVESIGHLGLFRNVKVLRNLTNIIISVYRLQ